MKLKLFTAMLMGFFALNACDSDHELGEMPTPETGKGFIPKITASAEQAPLTKAGVIEDNNYTKGENFYWTKHDLIKVVIGKTKKEYYVSEIDKGFPNQATFSSADTVTIQPGTYNNIVGYFPSSAWDENQEAEIVAVQEQRDATSEHLGSNMLMLAQNKNVVVNANATINLHYKHLASVFRFVVTNSSSNNNLKLTDISISLISSLGEGKPVFGTKVSLENDATSLTIDESSKVSRIGLKLTNTAQSFEDKNNEKQCEGYMVVLPVAKTSFVDSDTLVVEFTLCDETGRKFYKVTKAGAVGKLSGLLGSGFEQGKSYYIQQEINDTDLKEVRFYEVGDYYPDATNFITARGIVYWLDNPVDGKSDKGKIVSLDEKSLKWSTETILTYANSMDNGKANMATIKALNSDLSYPAFAWVHAKNSSTEDYSNNTSKGTWYLPAKNELRALYAGYSGRRYESISGWDYAMPSYNSTFCVAARIAFNDKLITARGTALSTDQYWSSSENINKLEWIVNFNDGLTYGDGKDYSFRARAVSDF